MAIDLGSPVATHPLTVGMIGWWMPLVNNSGVSTLFDIVSGYNGSLTSFSVPSVATSGWTQTGYGPGIVYDGTDDYVSLPSMSSRFSSEGTFAAWLRLPVNSPGSMQGSWDLGAQDTSSAYVWSDGNIYDGTFLASRVTVGAGVLSDRSQWHLVTVTCKPGSGNWVFYQNGIVANTSTGGASISFPSSPKVGVGAPTFGNFYFLGSIQWFALWNRALAQSEVLGLYSEAAKSLPNMIRRWSRSPTAYLSASPPPASTGKNLLLLGVG